MDRSLAWRLGLSAVIIPGLVVLFIVDHYAGESAPVLFVFAALLAVRSAWELSQIVAVRNIRARFVESAFGCVLLLAAAWWPHLPGATPELKSLELSAVALSVSVLILLGLSAARYREPGQTLESLGASLLILVYTGLLLAVTSQLRWVAGAQAGYLALGSLLVTAKCGDFGAYAVGRLFGKRKMAPRLSPGKTWAGFGGALGGATLGAWGWFTYATPRFGDGWLPPPPWAMLVYGLVIGLVALIGDLCESLIKRDAGKKDAAHLFPGFGGLLDLLDSVLYAGPVALILWRALPLVSW
jgi:phosphatidate cytidylyltransferase